MKSSELSGILLWHQWAAVNPNSAPQTPGVYVFRIASGRAVPRLKGESDVIYIGAAGKGKSSIRQRLRRHRDARQGVGDRLDRVAKETRLLLEVGWVSFENELEARAAESELFDMYSRDHIELPPLNRQESGIRVRGLARLITLLPADKRQEAIAKLVAPRGRDKIP